MSSRLKIGLSACFFHADPKRAIFKGKTLLYLEQSIANWAMSQGALVYLIPDAAPGTDVSLTELARELDGLILQGGSDVSPQSYGEKALRPEWSGDYIRDQYEIALTETFMTEKKPVLGICRGIQLLNVAFKGTLYQDIETQVPGALVHRNWAIYDQNCHDIELVSGSGLQRLYKGLTKAKVNSVHHQAIKDLAADFIVEARAEKDQIIEAVRHKGESYVYAVQWHPEFHDPKDKSFLDSAPLLQDFYAAVRDRRK